ncbi:MAG: hypothetical protein CVT67_07985 [Actinobacteria bacterium HGW-Actinobacteria-7]|nr:MAG: hypothetical protein CVT67_07985 [Actinobacteria bacterium HGW-Actinobacteria-7]
MPRTIIVSDLHGNARLLADILTHAGFSADDRLIVAGDLLDVGTDEMIELTESLGATILAGNHEVAAAIGLRIKPQNPETRTMAPELARRFASGEWPLAVAIDGWLVTHAGVSTALSDIIDTAGADVNSLAEILNTQFRDEISSAVRRMPLDNDQIAQYRLIGGELGPLWFRPMNPAHIPSGLRQIVGHTPPTSMGQQHLATLNSRGWLLIEPGGHPRAHGDPAVRYALVENGEARVIEE